MCHVHVHEFRYMFMSQPKIEINMMPISPDQRFVCMMKRTKFDILGLSSLRPQHNRCVSFKLEHTHTHASNSDSFLSFYLS